MAEDAKMLQRPLLNPMPPGQNASNGQTPGGGVAAGQVMSKEMRHD